MPQDLTGQPLLNSMEYVLLIVHKPFFLVIVRTFIVQRLKTENPDVMGMAVLGAGEGQHPRSVLLSWEVAAAEPRPSCSCRDLEKNLSCTTLCQVQSHVGHGI